MFPSTETSSLPVIWMPCPPPRRQRFPATSARLTWRWLTSLRLIPPPVSSCSPISWFPVISNDSPPRWTFRRILAGLSDSRTRITLSRIVSSATSVQNTSPPSTMLSAKVTRRAGSGSRTPEMATATPRGSCTRTLDSMMTSVGATVASPKREGSKSTHWSLLGAVISM
jgi:hypothetical protein